MLDILQTDYNQLVFNPLDIVPGNTDCVPDPVVLHLVQHPPHDADLRLQLFKTSCRYVSILK